MRSLLSNFRSPLSALRSQLSSLPSAFRIPASAFRTLLSALRSALRALRLWHLRATLGQYQGKQRRLREDHIRQLTAAGRQRYGRTALRHLIAKASRGDRLAQIERHRRRQAA